MIGLLIQISNYDIWKKIKFIINNFDPNIILMLHINSDLIKNEEIKIIKNTYNNAIFTYGENKGMDIYGFFIQIKYIIDNEINIDFICKIHTKSKDSWRNNMINTICGNNDIIQKCINTLNDPDVGMICSNKYLKLFDHYNTPIILNLLKQWNIENIFIDEIDWKEKYENLYDLDKFDPIFYVNYPYNKITLTDELLNNKDKLKSFAIFHWLKIGYKHFKYVTYSELIKKKINNHYKFCAGTIFWINGKILINFFKKYINFDEYNKFFERGYFLNDNPTFTHSWERIFSLIIYFNNKKIISF